MAKRRRRKKSASGFAYSVELTGLILVLIGIIGLGFGPIGKFAEKFAMFLTGEYYFIVLIILILLGFHMLFKRKLPKFFSSRKIGIYLIILLVLSIAHHGFIKEATSFSDVLSSTHENYIKRIDTITNASKPFTSGDNSISIGGGFVGALVSGALFAAVGMKGMIIVSIIIGIFAVILALNITLSDIIERFKDAFQKEEDEVEEKEKKKKKDEEDDIEEVDDEKEVINAEETNNKIVVASIDELKNNTIKEEVPETPSEESFEEEFESQRDSSSYRLPKYDLLTPVPKNKKNKEQMYIEGNKATLEGVLKDFEINGNVVATHIGPAVTEYEIKVSNGTKVNKVTNINKEIALAMAAKDVRIQAPIPGKSTIGVEIPNHEIAAVAFREVLEDGNTKDSKNKILMALGKDIMGRAIIDDLTKTPHLLVAGSTGSGKSVCINSIICSILMMYKPDEVKLVLVDPKKVELSNYNDLPHLLCPVVTDPKKANVILQKIVVEMENRYQTFSDNVVKNIAGYNEKIDKENKKHPDSPKERMPYIVVIIDELADLMLVASKEVQDSIMRITQMARAAGIHLIVATQRPSTDIITGVIKNNIPSRIAFAVSSSIDSRTILDASGAEKLLGRGDMLYLPMGTNIPTRIQGCFISDGEIQKLIDYCKTQATVKYNDEFKNADIHSSSSGGKNSEGDDDPMYDEIVEFAIQTGKISASLIQRRFRFGYNRAARVIDLLESRGIIGPQNGSKPREVLVKVEGNEEE